MAANTTTGEFWGLIVDASSKTICPVTRPFHVTKAVLSRPWKLTAEQYASVHLKGIDICKFTPGDSYEKNLNFTIRKGDNITFSVTGSGCPTPSIHLVGYYIPELTAPAQETTEALAGRLEKLLGEWKDKIIVELLAGKNSDLDKFAKLNESAATSATSIVALRETIAVLKKNIATLEKNVEERGVRLKKMCMPVPLPEEEEFSVEEKPQEVVEVCNYME